MEGNLERGWPSPRSWERVSTMLHLIENDKNNNERLHDISIEGLVGSGAGVEFNAYRKLSKQLTNVKEMMLNPKEKTVIPEKSDQKYALCSAMVYHLWRGKNQQEARQLLDGFFHISLKLSSDFAAMAMIDAMYGNDPEKANEYSKKLLEHPFYPEWQKKHGTALKKNMKTNAV